MNISYKRIGDYLLPNLILEKKQQFNIGKYGLLKLKSIKDNFNAGYKQNFKQYNNK